MTKIKLWISDIDGTIINYDGTYTKKMENTIKEVQKRGIKLVFATGRMFQGAKFAADNFNIKSPVVCYQGAQVRYKNEILWQAPIEDKIVREIIDYLRKNDIHTHLYSDDKLYVEKDDKAIMERYCAGRGTDYQVIKSFDSVKINNVPKMLAVIENPLIMEKIENELKNRYNNILTIVKSTPIYLEITDIKASKGNALNFLKTYWNLSDDEVIASGDQDNDVEMLKCAGIRVCVGSDSKLMKKTAQYNCKDVNSDELPALIERLVLCE